MPGMAFGALVATLSWISGQNSLPCTVMVGESRFRKAATMQTPNFTQLAVGDRDSALAFLRKCFSPEEWACICEQPEFTTMLRRVQTFNDAERGISLGLELIAREAGNWESHDLVAEAA